MLTAAFMFAFSCSEQSTAQEKPKTKPKDAQATTTAKVNSLLRAGDWIEVAGRLKELGSQGYDAYKEILEDPKVPELPISRGKKGTF